MPRGVLALPQRERRVLELLVAGLVLKEAAAVLRLSGHTVREYVRRAKKRKLGARTQSEVAYRFVALMDSGGAGRVGLRAAETADRSRPPLALTAREEAIVRLLRRAPRTVTPRALGLSPAVVRSTVARLRRGVGVRSRAALLGGRAAETSSPGRRGQPAGWREAATSAGPPRCRGRGRRMLQRRKRS